MKRRPAIAAAAAVITGTLALPAAATDAFPTTDDHSTTIAVKQWFLSGQTAAQVDAALAAHGARLTQVRVQDPATPTFTVSMVANTGAYAVANSLWTPASTSAQLTTMLSQNGARLISLDPYETPQGLRFAAVMIPNSGSLARSTWWSFNDTVTNIGNQLTTHGARLVSFRPYRLPNGTVRYAVIMVANSGQDFKGWEWFPGATLAAISSHVSTDSMRVVSLAPDPGGGFDAVLVSSEGEATFFDGGSTAATVSANLASHHTRLIDVSPYTSAGQQLFASVELDDANQAQAPINARSSAVQAFADANGWGGGFDGGYFATVGGTKIVAWNSGFRYEPASSIKVLYLLYTMKQVQAGAVALTDPITYYPDPADPTNPNVCPDPAWETPANAHTTTVQDALAQMMQISNNFMTRAFAIKWGLGPVQAMATGLGMANTHLRQPFIGCGFNGAVRNELTLVDASKLYAAVQKGTALSGTARTQFFQILSGGSPSSTDPYGTVVSEEAAAAGKSADVPAFLGKMDVKGKSGGYAFCLSNTCNPFKTDLAWTGRMLIPFMSAGKVVQHAYVFGAFVNDLMLPCAAGSGCPQEQTAQQLLNGVAAEEARTEIRAALATWP